MAAIWQAAVFCVLSTAGSETVLLDFYADWCAPCRAMNPVLEQLARRGYPIRKVNIDHHPDLAARFGVRAVPCFVMLVDGREVGREVGQVSLARLEQLCLLGRQNRTGPDASRNLIAAGNSSGAPGRQNPVGATMLGHPAGSTRAPTTKDGLPIPVVQLGVPRDPAVPTASPHGSTEAVASASANLAVQQPAAVEFPVAPPPTAFLQSASVTEQELLACTVRLRVFQGDSLSHGTGTIIDARQGEALILTCGHLFRESQGNGRIEVEIFGPDGVQKLPGRLIAWNEQRDLGLVSIRTPGPVRAARVAPVGYPLKKGLLVFSVGCDHGQDPTVRKTWIVSINRYLGSPNLQVADQPVSGRSGGGLFTQEGYLIGVCNAADPADREGLFSSLPAIHAQLDEARLQFVYQDPPALPPQMPRPNPSNLAQTNGLAPPDGSAPTNPPSAPGVGLSDPSGRSTPRLSAVAPEGIPSAGGPLMELAAALRSEPIAPDTTPEPPRFSDRTVPDRIAPTPGGVFAATPPAVSQPNGGGRNDPRLVSVEAGQRTPGGLRIEDFTQARGLRTEDTDRTGQAGGLRAEESALLAEIARRWRQGAEVIFIVRPTDDPQAKSEIFVLNQASPELLARLGAAARRSEIRETSLIVGPERKGTGSLEPSDLSPASQPIPDPSQRQPFSLPPPVPSAQ